MKKKLESNIWKYTIFLISNKRIFVAILGAYYLTIPGVTPVGIGIILLVGSLAGFLFEIPSGYLSDKMGHKSALVMSRFLMFASTLIFLLATDINFLIIGGALLSVAFAFVSGTGSAFMHETLKGLGKEEKYAEITGKQSSIGFAVPLIFMVLTPFLVSISFKAPFILALLVDFIGILAALSLTATLVEQKDIEEIRLTNFKQVIKEGHSLNFFVFAALSGIIGGTLFGLSGFRAPYQMFLEIPVIYFGVLMGIGRIAASILLAYSGKIREKTTMFSLYKFKIFTYTALILILGFVSTWWIVVIVFIIINAINHGLSKVSSSYKMNLLNTSKFKATLLSIGSQINKLIAAISGFGVGYMVERLSYQTSFLYLGIIFFAVTFPLYLYISLKHRQNYNI